LWSLKFGCLLQDFEAAELIIRVMQYFYFLIFKFIGLKNATGKTLVALPSAAIPAMHHLTVRVPDIVQDAVSISITRVEILKPVVL
jgi:hypothetical protein